MTSPPAVRPYRPGDHDALHEICVRTAHNGGDSRPVYTDPDVFPATFATPYAHLEPELTFVLDDGHGQAVGYILGTANTPAFVEDFREKWLPLVADRFPAPLGPPATPDEAIIQLLHHPERMLRPEVVPYPAHLHIDLLPAWQGRGHGRALMHTFLRALHTGGVPAVHLSMVTTNTPARAFYDRLGFHEIEVPDPGPVTYLGRTTKDHDTSPAVTRP
ncbi:GNAT family N-acetyltransferase [Streptomyces europaeiscabiei]|uniref:GNAT family N-acetyltransferase n=1 Tax=Streptomyces TaxID=1883 RepID=UPI000A365611|nr:MULTISPECIES: GNAT family N-acetyltransferase [Streptomyces]MDX3585438.1 GNAT family N-acetyltransferase [Streptomyces europaeiscabiei]MDX3633234.1 GNAT family N-acetyltransferase [Streptomyces europaeiscabiei]MDX3650860.1 GNAT family N-acetyltransferase [Streptomyces europaeiscabiei]WUD30387.1 GNAT family N-acetyltransferase [Streptomyces europaeiscabiei]